MQKKRPPNSDFCFKALSEIENYDLNLKTQETRIDMVNGIIKTCITIQTTEITPVMFDAG